MYTFITGNGTVELTTLVSLPIISIECKLLSVLNKVNMLYFLKFLKLHKST